MSKLKNIVFDFDGVIADTFDTLFAMSIAHQQGLTHEDFLAHHDGNVFEEPVIDFTEESATLFREQYRKRLTPSHIANAIAPLKELGAKYNLFVISSNDEIGIESVLEVANVRNLFTAVMGVETHRSKVEKFRIMESKYNADLSKTVFITDTLGDVKEGHVVGVPSIAVTFGFHPRERLELGNPWKIADSWSEVLKTIEDFNK